MKTPYYVFLMFFILVGCSANVETSNQPKITEKLVVMDESPIISQKTIAPTLVKTEKPTATPTETLANTEFSTSTREISQIDLESTATVPPTFTITPLPTLSPDEGPNVIFNLIKGNDQCRLPCWGGIIPGEIGWDEISNLSQPYIGLAISHSLYLDEDCAFGRCNVVSWWYWSPDFNISQEIYFSLVEKSIHSISVEALKIPTIDGLWVKNVLNQFGTPSLALIAVNPYSPDGFGAEVFTNLMLVYPDYQFIIVYSFDAQAQGDEFVSCIPNNSFRLEILSSGIDISSFDRMNASPILSEQMRSWSNGFGWHQIENVTDLTIQEFVEEYTTKEIPCFATPIEIWR